MRCQGLVYSVTVKSNRQGVNGFSRHSECTRIGGSSVNRAGAVPAHAEKNSAGKLQPVHSCCPDNRFELFPFIGPFGEVRPADFFHGFGHEALVSVSFGAPTWLILAGLMLLMAILTNIVSNNAAAVIGTPIAISIAMELGLPLEPFVLAVLFGANLSFVTPMAYKTNLLVMNAGGYKFMDFVKVGIPLTVIMWVALTEILTLAYEL